MSVSDLITQMLTTPKGEFASLKPVGDTLSDLICCDVCTQPINKCTCESPEFDTEYDDEEEE